MRVITIVASFTLFLFTSAQPTITSLEVPGDGAMLVTSTYMIDLPLSDGPDQTWGVNGIPIDWSDSGTSIAPATTPYSSVFPTATFAVLTDQGEYSFYEVSNTGCSILGTHVDGTENRRVYVDPRKYFTLPATLGTAWTDTFRFEEYDDQGNFIRAVQEDVHYSITGWGSLTAPFGMFEDVLQLTTEEYIRDSITINNILYVAMAEREELWHASSLYPLVAHTIFRTYSNGTQTGIQHFLTFFRTIPVGEDELTQRTWTPKIYPNPCDRSFWCDLVPGLTYG